MAVLHLGLIMNSEYFDIGEAPLHNTRRFLHAFDRYIVLLNAQQHVDDELLCAAFDALVEAREQLGHPEDGLT